MSTPTPTRDDLRNAVHRGVMSTYPMSVMEAVGYTQGGYDALLDGIADAVLAAVPTEAAVREQIARDIETLRPDAAAASPVTYRIARDEAARIARGGAA